MEFRVRNVNQGFNSMLWWLKTAGVHENSRNGGVVVAPSAVLVTYTRPLERCLWWPERDVNPFFSLFESLWMLAGRNDVNFVGHYAKRMFDYSDDGEILNAAYGFRWRFGFSMDQLEVLADHLRRNPESRRAVLTMWSPNDDLTVVDTSKDVCCNTQAYFDLRGGKLNMTVLNRSNDVVWGMFGANVVHFAFLQEYIACKITCPVGEYRQFSNNAHLYKAQHAQFLEPPTEVEDHYGTVVPYPLGAGDPYWEEDLHNFFEDWENGEIGQVGYNTPFFHGVVRPMSLAHGLYRHAMIDKAQAMAETIIAEDWRLACRMWLQRRVK